jgi:hypothetical protein
VSGENIYLLNEAVVFFFAVLEVFHLSVIYGLLVFNATVDNISDISGSLKVKRLESQILSMSLWASKHDRQNLIRL